MACFQITYDLYHQEIFPKIRTSDIWKLRLLCKGFKELVDHQFAKQRNNITVQVENKQATAFKYPVGTLTLKGPTTTLRNVVEYLHQYQPNRVYIRCSVNKGSKIPKRVGVYANPIEVSYDGMNNFPIDSIAAAVPNITSLSNRLFVRLLGVNDYVLPLSLDDLLTFKNLKSLDIAQSRAVTSNIISVLDSITDSISWVHRVTAITAEQLETTLSSVFLAAKSKVVTQRVDFCTLDNPPIVASVNVNATVTTSPDRQFNLHFSRTSNASSLVSRVHIHIKSARVDTTETVGFKTPNLQLSGCKEIVLVRVSDVPVTIQKVKITPYPQDDVYHRLSLKCKSTTVTIESLDFVGSRFSKQEFKITIHEALQCEEEVRELLFGTNISNNKIFSSNKIEAAYIDLSSCNAQINVLDIPFTQTNIRANLERLNNVKILNLHPVKAIIFDPKCFFDTYVKPDLREAIGKLDCKVNIVFEGTTTLIKEETPSERQTKRQKTK